MAKTRTQYYKEIRDLLGEVYSTEMFSDSFILTQINNAKVIINYFKGGKWDWAITDPPLIVPITSAISEYTLPADYLTDMKIAYGQAYNSSVPFRYVTPANYDNTQASYDQFTIKGNKIKFRELNGGNLYLEYYKRLPDLISSQDIAFDNMPIDLELAIVNYAVGMGYRKKRQFGSANEFIGDEINSKKYPMSFWTVLKNYAENHIMSHSLANYGFRPNVMYI